MSGHIYERAKKIHNAIVLLLYSDCDHVSFCPRNQ
jgi:hypothetical protein